MDRRGLIAKAGISTGQKWAIYIPNYDTFVSFTEEVLIIAKAGMSDGPEMSYSFYNNESGY